MKNFWLIFGFCGQFIFGSRFLIQWIYSERAGKSYIPVVFWYLSIMGAIILLIYAINIKDPVFIVGQATGIFVYGRNLYLISNEKKGTGTHLRS